MSRRRALTGRLSTGHVVTILAGLVAALLNVAALRAGDGAVLVAVTTRDLAAGETLTADALRFEEVRAGDRMLASLVEREEVDALVGGVAAAPLPAGSAVAPAMFVDAAAPEGLRALSIPIDPAHAVGGDLTVGDRVDVIEVRDGIARYVLTGAPVLAVSDTAGHGLGVIGEFSVTVAVDDASALALASAMAAETIELVKSTGAAPPRPELAPPAQP